MANSVDPGQTAPIGAVYSWSTLFASILNSSIMLGNYCSRQLQQTTFSDAFFSWHFKGIIYFFRKILSGIPSMGAKQFESRSEWKLTLYLLVSSADIFCK